MRHQCPEHHEKAMLSVAAEFYRLLRVRVNSSDFISEEEIDKVVRVPCKPAQPRPPSADDLRRLAPYQRAFKEVLDAQKRRCFDAEALTEAFAPLLKEVGHARHWGTHCGSVV